MALDASILESEDFKAAVAAAAKEMNAAIEKNRNQALEDKAKYRDRLAEYGDITPEEARTLAEAKKKAEQEAARKAGDYEALENKLKKDFAKQVEQIAGERDSYKTSLERVLIERDAIEGITDAGGFVKILKPHVIDRMQLQPAEDGTHRAVIVDDKGQPRLKKGASSTTDFMSVKEFVDSLREDDEFSHAFRGSGASGGATPDRVAHGGKSSAGSKDRLRGAVII